MITQTAQQFSDSVLVVEPLGNGYINDTYKVETKAKSFVLQRINAKVFPNPDQIMANLQVLSRHGARQNNPSTHLKIPQLYPTQNGEIAYRDGNGDFWRAWEYIDNTDCFETIARASQAHAVGKALGQFHCLVSSLNPNDLHDTLPGFHVAPQYFAHYQQVKRATKIAEDGGCAKFIEDHHQAIIHDLEHAKAKGLLPIRVIHGDPKLNNFLFDKDSHQVVSIIDLDTVKPGLLHYDIGDCIRSCCHDLATDQFDLDCCKALLTSYLKEMGGYFTANDYEFLYPAIRLIPFELGLRFYTDYLEGNRYFKVQDARENVFRAIGQFRLCADIIGQEVEIKQLIRSLC